MSVFIDGSVRIIVQGITGKEGSYWTRHMQDLGTRVVAGVTPGKAGQNINGVPVFNSVRQAVANIEVDASMIFVPPQFTKDAVLEALDSKIRKIVTIADGIPLHEQLQIRRQANICGAMVIGGNTSGAITPGKAMMGVFPYWIKRVYSPGHIGVMTRSGSLTNEVTAMIVKSGFGVSTLIGVGGDPVPATRFAELLPMFEADDGTDAMVIIGELGGTMEEEVAEAIKTDIFKKPLVAYLSGRTAPKGRRMGHAGAIITGGKGAVEDKIAALTAVGAEVAERPSQVGELLRGLLDKAGR